MFLVEAVYSRIISHLQLLMEAIMYLRAVVYFNCHQLWWEAVNHNAERCIQTEQRSKCAIETLWFFLC